MLKFPDMKNVKEPPRQRMSLREYAQYSMFCLKKNARLRECPTSPFSEIARDFRNMCGRHCELYSTPMSVAIPRRRLSFVHSRHVSM